MTISFDFDSYLQHKVYFDEMAMGMKNRGHRVGIITGVREKDPFTNEDLKAKLITQLGFNADFIRMWGQNESIANGNAWKVARMVDEDVLVHYDDDATEIKKYTDRWIIKVMLNGQEKKF